MGKCVVEHGSETQESGRPRLPLQASRTTLSEVSLMSGDGQIDRTELPTVVAV